MHYEGPDVRRGNGRDTISDDVLARELSDEVWIGLVSYRKKESGARAFTVTLTLGKIVCSRCTAVASIAKIHTTLAQSRPLHWHHANKSIEHGGKILPYPPMLPVPAECLRW